MPVPAVSKNPRPPARAHNIRSLHSGEAIFRWRPSGDQPDGRSPRLEEPEAFGAGSQSSLASRYGKAGIAFLDCRPEGTGRAPSPRVVEESAQPRLATHGGEAQQICFACKPAGTGRIGGPRVLRNPEHPAQVRYLDSRQGAAHFLLPSQRGPAWVPVPASSRQPRRPAQIRNPVSLLKSARPKLFAVFRRGPGKGPVPAGERSRIW